LRNFNVKDSVPLVLPETNTKEFKQLNQFISGMSEKARADYISLKEFSENASHEMQTPIAIASGKLELLLNNPDMQATHLELVQSAQMALSKLSKLGSGLALLSKIGNQEFLAQKPINFSNQVKESLSLYADLAELKSIKIKKDIKAEVYVPIDSSLADILIGNLFKNAIQHNYENGWIAVHLTSNILSVSNSGEVPKFNTEEFFGRFRKNNQSSNSLGLGLSIVQRICEVNNFDISYKYLDGAHRIEISF
jgi:signal transduction histidine kinase